MSKIIHTTLAYGYYYAGDIICHLPWGWSYEIYRWLMNKSTQHDEQIGYKIWQEPDNFYKHYEDDQQT